MKSEDHTAQLATAFICEVYVVFACFHPGVIIDYFDGVRPLSDQLPADILLGGSLLPIIAALRRGRRSHKISALILAVLPTLYIYGAVEWKLPIFIQVWENN
jgi:hypothetical protein